PDFVLGASLGEVVGAVVTGMLTVEDALRFVIGQAKVFNNFCLPGGMMAVLCSPDIYTEYSQMVEGCELSGLNGSEIFVVSGSNAALTRFEAFLKARDIATSRLPVSHAFHSRLMDPAKQNFLALLSNVEVKKPHIPMLSCTRVDFAEEVSHEYFWDVVRKPLNVRDAVQKLLYLGDYVYLDISPSGTMSNLVKYNAKNQTVPKTLFLLQPFGGESARLQSVVEELKTMFPKP
ncbi:MAG: acyltransferase domain-containing protein, partial [Blastocatellia bacterium]|nr:acyltransferase domain-containing protein [Blastocatellia bacterium]